MFISSFFDFSCTNNRLDSIKIEEGLPTYAEINPESNKLYISYHGSDFILQIDCSTKKIARRIDIAKPSQIAINLGTNIVFVITDGKVSAIDESTNKLIYRLDEDEGIYHYASSLAVNPATNLMYVIYGSADIMCVFNCSTKTKVANIRLEQPSGVAVDASLNRIYVANYESNLVSIIDGSSNTVIDNIVIPHEKGGFLSSIWQHLEGLFVNPMRKLLYVRASITAAVAGGSGTTDHLCVIDIATKNQINKRGLSIAGLNGIPINTHNNRVYDRNIMKNAILKLDEFAKETLETVELEKMGFWKRVFTARDEAIAVNPVTNKVYFTESRLGLLYILDG